MVCHYEKNGKTLVAKGEVCVIAIGRKANTGNIELETVEIKHGSGFISVDERMLTGEDNVYAVGDITGKAQLAHVASSQGIVAAQNIAGQDKKMKYNIIPSCIYTSPEIAYVGLDEKSAKNNGYDVAIGQFFVSGNGKSMIMGEKSGMVKLITESRTGEILGAQIMAPRATDIISEICAAMKAESTIEELEDTIHPHPSISEMIMEAAHDVSGLCIHKS